MGPTAPETGHATTTQIDCACGSGAAAPAADPSVSVCPGSGAEQRRTEEAAALECVAPSPTGNLGPGEAAIHGSSPRSGTHHLQGGTAGRGSPVPLLPEQDVSRVEIEGRSSRDSSSGQVHPLQAPPCACPSASADPACNVSPPDPLPGPWPHTPPAAPDPYASLTAAPFTSAGPAPAIPFRVAALNVVLLSCCFGLGWTSLFIQVSATTVYAKELAGTALSLVPYGLFALTHATWAIPAQILMKHFRPKPFYLLGSCAGAVGNAIMVWASLTNSFALLLVGSPFCGFANSYVNFLRFEAARFVSSPKNLPVAISTVVAGGVIGAALGPIISRFTRNLLPQHEFLATYIVAVAVWLLEGSLVSLIHFRPAGLHAAPLKEVIVAEGKQEEGDQGQELRNGFASQALERLEPGKHTDGEETEQSKWTPSETCAAVLPASAAAEVTALQRKGCSEGTEDGMLCPADPHEEPGGCVYRGDSDTHQQTVPKERGSSLSRCGSLPAHARKWHEFFRSPVFLVAVTSSTLSYTFMAVFMLSSVIAMTAVQPGSYAVDFAGPSNQAITFADTSNAIIVHVEAMFFPSFFTGYIIRAIGADGSMFLGFAVQVLSEFILLASTQLWNFYLSLALLGLGWNLAFVGATAALSTCYRPDEKDLVQGMNDAITFGVNMIFSATASVVLEAISDWNTFVVLYSCLTLPGLAATCWFWLSRQLLLFSNARKNRSVLNAKKKLQGRRSATARFRMVF